MPGIQTGANVCRVHGAHDPENIAGLSKKQMGKHVFENKADTQFTTTSGNLI